MLLNVKYKDSIRKGSVVKAVKGAGEGKKLPLNLKTENFFQLRKSYFCPFYLLIFLV